MSSRTFLTVCSGWLEANLIRHPIRLHIHPLYTTLPRYTYNQPLYEFPTFFTVCSGWLDASLIRHPIRLHIHTQFITLKFKLPGYTYNQPLYEFPHILDSMLGLTGGKFDQAPHMSPYTPQYQDIHVLTISPCMSSRTFLTVCSGWLDASLIRVDRKFLHLRTLSNGCWCDDCEEEVLPENKEYT